MIEHEERGLPYLFKLQHTAKVEELVNRMMRQGALWQDCGDGWKALESSLIAHAFTSTSNESQQIRATTERWTIEQRWTLFLTRVLRRWLGGKWLPGLPEEAALILSG
jgi:ribosomal protein S7